VHNIRTFNPSNYLVRILPNTEIMFPYLQLYIFDERSVLTGGFHVDQGPPTDPYMSYVGSRFAEFYLKVWDRLFHGYHTINFNIIDRSKMLDVVVSELRKFTKPDGTRPFQYLTGEELEDRVVDREKYIDEYAPRF